MFLVDSHCHLDGLDYQTLHKNVDDVLAKAAARDVKFCLAVATTLPGYRSMRELVGTRDNPLFFLHHVSKVCAVVSWPERDGS